LLSSKLAGIIPDKPLAVV